MISLHDLSVNDLKEAFSLWTNIPELKFPVEFDTEERLTKFLLKNKNLSSIAKTENSIVGA